jgi:hypothetical protein
MEASTTGCEFQSLYLMGSVVVLLEVWARKWLRRMLLTSGSI